ncbi:MAG: amidohydrolase family protein [Flavobacteriales bacterium]|nr:amidohydrolase family protein [Flavobacteriales bacterium]
MFRYNMYLILSVLTLFLYSCDQHSESEEPYAEVETVYLNGSILTMKGVSPEYVECIAIAEGEIVYVGDEPEVAETFPQAEIVDLQGKTMLPGFIDAHCHFAGFPAQGVGAKILPPPDATVDSIDELVRVLKEWATPENIELTGWIFGMGLDDSVIRPVKVMGVQDDMQPQSVMPTKDDLDRVSMEYPVIAIHISGHLAVVNSKGLEELGIDENTADPPGGKIRRVLGTMEPNGVLEELAIIPKMAEIVNPSTPEAAKVFLDSGIELALSYGYTTVQEGRAFLTSHQFLSSAAEYNQLPMDVVSYIDYSCDSLLLSDWYSDSYKNNYRIGGVKLTLDGSPQGRTAWCSHPYLIPPDGESAEYSGYPVIANDSIVKGIYDKCYKNNWQILTHCNGDAAMDQMIRTLSPVVEKYGVADRRTVLIHGQYIRKDQLAPFDSMNVIASLFPMHTYYWGDWHRQLIGDSLVQFISPTRAVLERGMRLTIHSDSPVALPNMMRLVGTAVNRTSRSGRIVGPDQRLTPYEALKCITEWSAYQHFEEDMKGTIEVGKVADLVVLDQNPLKVPVESIEDITVTHTIKEGKVIYTSLPENR